MPQRDEPAPQGRQRVARELTLLGIPEEIAAAALLCQGFGVEAVKDSMRRARRKSPR